MNNVSQRLSAHVDVSTVLAIAPKVSGSKRTAQAAIITAFGGMLPDILVAAEATSEIRIEHLLAQVAHESDGFCTLVEYASGKAYEGRKDLGNIHAGDGVKFKGRGLIQLTGRANYRAFTGWMRKRIPDCPDFEAHPEHVAEWPWAGWALAFYWSSRQALNIGADRDDLVIVTKAVNGGTNGLAERAAYLTTAKIAVVTIAADMISEHQQFPVLRRGMSGSIVEDVQRALQAVGFYLLSIDGVFGAGTEGAVRAFQKARGLDIDGIVGLDTAAALWPYLPSGGKT